MLVDGAFLERARAASADDPLYTRGLVSHPGKEHVARDRVEDCAFELGDGSTTEDRAMEGELFVDGSAYKSIFDDLSTAGWSVVALNEAGGLDKALYGPVWPQLPQESSW